MIDLFLGGDVEMFWFAVKLALLLFLSIYLVFSFVIIKQVRLMNDTLEIGFENAIKYISYLHFMFAVFVFILAVFIL